MTTMKKKTKNLGEKSFSLCFSVQKYKIAGSQLSIEDADQIYIMRITRTSILCETHKWCENFHGKLQLKMGNRLILC